MKTILTKLSFIAVFTWISMLTTSCTEQEQSMELTSKSGLNKIVLSLDENGSFDYEVERNGASLISKSPLGLKTASSDYTTGLTVVEVYEVKEKREHYELVVANSKQIDLVLDHRSVTFKNKAGDSLIIDL